LTNQYRPLDLGVFSDKPRDCFLFHEASILHLAGCYLVGSVEETNGNSMTHCSLKGCSETFTNTGKWFFPETWQNPAPKETMDFCRELRKREMTLVVWIFVKNREMSFSF
jgi:hypothetical protein